MQGHRRSCRVTMKNTHFRVWRASDTLRKEGTHLLPICEVELDRLPLDARRGHHRGHVPHADGVAATRGADHGLLEEALLGVKDASHLLDSHRRADFPSVSIS